MPYRKAWEVAYQRDRAAGISRYVDAEPTRTRLAELAAGHVPLRALARASGLSDTAVKAILSGDRARVRRASAEAVAAVSLYRIYTEQAAGHLPRVGAVRRVQALMAMGWSHHDLAVAGAPNTAGLLASSGHLVTVGRWRQVRDVYDRLSMTPGPSPQTRGWARALGYAPPLAWDEDTIDDPTASARGLVRAGPGAEVVDMVAVRRTIDAVSTGAALSSGEQREVVRLMASSGASDAQIARRLGVVDRTVMRMRQRHGIASRRPQAARTQRELEWAGSATETHTRSRTATLGAASSTSQTRSAGVGR